MITENEYLEAKKITDEYEEQLNIPLVIWRCTKTLYMHKTREQVFTKGKEYTQTQHNCLEAIDNKGRKHGISGWEKHFIAI